MFSYSKGSYYSINVYSLYQSQGRWVIVSVLLYLAGVRDFSPVYTSLTMFNIKQMTFI